MANDGGLSKASYLSILDPSQLSWKQMEVQNNMELLDVKMLDPSTLHPECHFSGKRSVIEVDDNTIHILAYPHNQRGSLQQTLKVPVREIASVSMRTALQANAATTCCHHFDGPVMYIHSFRRKQFDWIPVDHAVEFMEEAHCRMWTAYIQSLLHAQADRPFHVFVVINPYGGSRRADYVWQDTVKPIFERAQMRCDAHRTGYQDHAVELLENMPLEQFLEYDGIVSVGGDGLFQECLRGLLAIRARGGAWRAKALSMRIAQVPAGSTDAVAFTINGCRSAVTAALHVVVGDRAKLDVLEVRTQEAQCRYACSTASYGFIGDVLDASEAMRWMGPARYDVSGALTFARLKSYQVRLWYKLPVAPHPIRKVCGSDCQICSRPTANMFDVGEGELSVESEADRAMSPGHSELRSGDSVADTPFDSGAARGGAAGGGAGSVKSGHSFHMRGASGFGEQSLLVSAASGAGAGGRQESMDLMSAAGGNDAWFADVQADGHGSSSVGDNERWRCWEGEISSLMVCVTATRSDKSKNGLVPHAHLSDGRVHLVIVRKCTRVQFFRFLLSLARGGVDESLSFVDVKEVEAWRLEELRDQPGVWNVDGELMQSRNMSAQVHHGLIHVFGRGPELC